MKKLFCWALVITSVVWSACDDDDDNDLQAVDKTFATNAGYANAAEVDLGQLAATRGTTEGVRMYGQMMVNEHTTAQNELKGIVNGRGVTLPTTPDQEHQQLKQQLMSLNGMAFDSAYIHNQVIDHQKTQTLFQNEQTGGKDQRLKNYATKYLPHIQMHLQKADSIKNAMGQ
jgi:putative membrane protein